MLSFADDLIACTPLISVHFPLSSLLFKMLFYIYLFVSFTHAQDKQQCCPYVQEQACM